MATSNTAESLTAADNEEIAQYELILEIAGKIWSRKHPTLKIPADKQAQAQATLTEVQADLADLWTKPSLRSLNATPSPASAPPALPHPYGIPYTFGNRLPPLPPLQLPLTFPTFLPPLPPASFPATADIPHYHDVTIDFGRDYYKDLGVEPHVLADSIIRAFKHQSPMPTRRARKRAAMKKVDENDRKQAKVLKRKWIRDKKAKEKAAKQNLEEISEGRESDDEDVMAQNDGNPGRKAESGNAPRWALST
ncbi:hypothetical protein G7Y89_g5563 [Cudoniella acicularis]|uniref:Uncharacterized protein n=1 Tax=Cudoniella acicularis TaxID=354080 RepID=A0A8H4RNT8_9HELO|nr:hypothetical protein G7Y89_g5563 [Cudoniella acicularis]